VASIEKVMGVPLGILEAATTNVCSAAYASKMQITLSHISQVSYLTCDSCVSCSYGHTCHQVYIHEYKIKI